MGTISEYFQIKSEIDDIKEEINKKIKDPRETSQSRSEFIQHMNKKLLSKKKMLKIVENRILVIYVFPMFIVVLILIYVYLRYFVL
ncbi:hypothetical protein [Methanococcus sp. CF]